MTHYESIAREVASKMGVTWPEVIGNRRTSSITKARHAICGVLRTFGMSYGEIADMLNYDGHWTAIYGAAKYQELPQAQRDAFMATIDAARGVTRLFNQPVPDARLSLAKRREAHAVRYRRKRQRMLLWDSLGDTTTKRVPRGRAQLHPVR